MNLAAKGLVVNALDLFLIALVRYPTVAHDWLLRSISTSVGMGTMSVTSNYSMKSPSEILRKKGCIGWFSSGYYLHLLRDFVEQLLINPDINDKDLNQPYSFYKRTLFYLIVTTWIDLATVAHTQHYQVSKYRKLMTVQNENKLKGKVNRKIKMSKMKYLIIHNWNLFLEIQGMAITERPHPAATEVVVLETNSFKWTIGSCQVLTYLL